MTRYGAQRTFDTLAMAYMESVRRESEALGLDDTLKKIRIDNAENTVEQLRREHDASLSFMRGETLDRNTRKAMENDIKSTIRR